MVLEKHTCRSPLFKAVVSIEWRRFTSIKKETIKNTVVVYQTIWAAYHILDSTLENVMYRQTCKPLLALKNFSK